jgi:hypothetical protein
MHGRISGERGVQINGESRVREQQTDKRQQRHNAAA